MKNKNKKKCSYCLTCKDFMPTSQVETWDYCQKAQKSFSYVIYNKTPEWCPANEN